MTTPDTPASDALIADILAFAHACDADMGDVPHFEAAALIARIKQGQETAAAAERARADRAEAEVARLREACGRALALIAALEQQFDVKLNAGDFIRAALATQEPGNG